MSDRLTTKDRWINFFCIIVAFFAVSLLISLVFHIPYYPDAMMFLFLGILAIGAIIMVAIGAGGAC